jgi:alanyl-tRNA synthetase
MYQLVFNYTPFYAESGGQIGDTGYIEADSKKTYIIDTRKENDLIIHFSKEMPTDPKANFHAVVNRERRENIKRNHTATHLLHHALRNVLGEHVEQKGSFVGPDYLRFDFSHFGKMTPEEIKQVEHIVNTEIRENHPLNEKRAIPMEEARDMGALAFFGEKYGDLVRVINFGDSTELCGGTHVTATGNIGIIKITSEGAIAAGIRRIEALTGTKAEEYLYNMTDTVMQAKAILKNQKDIVKGIEMLQEANHELQKEIEILKKEKAAHVRKNILSQVIETEKYTLLATEVELDASTMKDLAFQLKGQISNYVIVLGTKADGKAGLLVMIDEDTVKVNQLNAGAIIRELAVEIKGGGGGQPHFASAGGKNPDGIPAAIEKAKQLLA